MRGGWLIALLAACGDGAGAAVDASRADGPPWVDAKVCPPGDVPAEIVSGNADLSIPITLDGVGDRCDQLKRAVLVPGVIPEVDPIYMFDLDAACGTSSGVDVVTVSLPVTGGPWGILISIDGSTVVGWSGTYLAVDELPAPDCLSETDLMLGLANTEFRYAAFDASCAGTYATYQVQVGDRIVVGDPVFVLDDSLRLHRARVVDVLLLPSHVTEPMLRSSMYCCDGGPPIDCVGSRIAVDTSSLIALDGAGSLCDYVCYPE